jgi:branched-chain amino acid transport system substrate-binding protein
MAAKTVSIITVFFLLSIFFLSVPLFGDSRPVRIGATLSLTGAYAEPSGMMYQAYRLWESQINAEGGLLGRRVELIIRDDRSDPRLAADMYRGMIDDEGVELVLSPYSTPITAAVSAVTENRGVPLIAAGASGDILWARGFEYIFGMYSMARRYFIGFIDLFAREGLEGLSIFYEDNDFNVDAAEGALEWAERMGVDVLDRRIISSDGALIDEAIAGFADNPGDGVIICAYPEAAYELLARLESSGLRPAAVAVTIIPVHPDFLLKAGTSGDGVFGPSQWEPMERIPFPGTREFIRDFTAYSGKAPSYHAGSAYSSCQIISQALRVVGKVDRQAIRDYISDLDTVTVIGHFKNDRQGRQVGHNPILIQWQNGRKEIVYPRSMRTADPVF